MKALLQKLNKIIELLLEEREERKMEKEETERLKNEANLIEYAKRKGKKMPTGGIHSSRELAEAPMNTDGDLIPFGLGDRDKAILDEFYNGH